MQIAEILHLTIAELGRAYRRRDLSPVEVVNALLERIRIADRHLNSFILVTAEEALNASRKAERAFLQGEGSPPLLGVPVAVKDIIDIEGHPTTCASPILRDVVAAADARVVERFRDAGATIIGKNNMLEFAYGEVHPDYGPTPNPWDHRYSSSGSSSGSAVAVAASLAYASMGTDTGGSIRLPAAYCGVVGHKPTYGLVSRWGVVPLAWSLDHVGPLTRTVADAALVMDAVVGYDPRDPGSANRPVPSYFASLTTGIAGMRVALLEREVQVSTHPEVREAVEAAARVLEGLGAHIEPCSFPGLYESIDALMVIMQAEATAHHKEWLRTRPQDYSPPVRHRLRLGGMISAVDYLHAQRIRRELCWRVSQVMKDVDVFVLPTAASGPTLRGHPRSQHREHEDPMAALIWRTGPFNLTGQPALTLPCGFTNAGLPIGLQIVGRPFQDEVVLQVAYAYERATEWHKRRPPVT